MSFERDIRKKLIRHKTPVDIDALWNDLQGEIPTEKDEKRKKRVSFYLYLGFLLLVLGGVGAFSVPTSSRLQIVEEEPFVHTMQYIHFSDWKVPVFSNSQALVANLPTKQRGSELEIYRTVQEIQPQTPSSAFVSTIEKKEVSISPLRMNTEVEKISTDKFFVQLLDEITIKSKEKGTEDEKETAASPKRKTRIGFTISYANSKAILKANNQKTKGLVRGREHSESGVGTYQLGADVMIPVGKKWWFRTGLAYTHIREKTLLTKREDTYARSSEVASSRSEENMLGYGNTSLDGDDNHPNQITRISGEKAVYSSYNTHHFLDIPLVMAYEMGQKNVFLLVEGGLHLNLFHVYTQREVLNDKSYSFKYKIDTPFKESTGLSTYTGVSLLWKVQPKTALKFGVSWSYNIHSLSKSYAGIDQRYNTIGMNIGVMRSF